MTSSVHQLTWSDICWHLLTRFIWFSIFAEYTISHWEGWTQGEKRWSRGEIWWSGGEVWWSADFRFNNFKALGQPLKRVLVTYVSVSTSISDTENPRRNRSPGCRVLKFYSLIILRQNLESIFYAYLTLFQPILNHIISLFFQFLQNLFVDTAEC